jgi:lactoylglutathione lyase
MRLMHTVRWIIVCGVVLCTSFIAYAQKPYVTFNHVAIMVTDANKSADFYIHWFHLDNLKNPFPGRPIRWLSLGGKMQLHLIQGAKREVTVSKDNHIAFSVASLDAFVARLKKEKIVYEDGDGHAGKLAVRSDKVRQAYFRDPDVIWWR